MDVLVYFKLKGNLYPKYCVIGKNEFILREGDWSNVFPISPKGQSIISQYLK